MYLEKKSNENFELAHRLVNLDKQYYSAAIHCAYFGCLQQMKFLLNKFNIKTYAVLDSLSKSEGSHRIILSSINTHFIKKYKTNYPPELGTILDNYNSIKENRIKSDYLNVELTLDDATSTLSKSNEIIEKLKLIL